MKYNEVFAFNMYALSMKDTTRNKQVSVIIS